MPIEQSQVEECIARCADLGLCAVVMDERGVPLAGTPASIAPERLLATVSLAAARERIMGNRGEAEVSLWPGCRAVVSRVEAGGGHGYLAALLLTTAGATSAQFVGACAEAGVAHGAALAAAGQIGRAGSSEMTARVLGMIVRDSGAALEHTRALDSFGAHLGDSFDTIDVLYSIGRSMRDPTNPRHFLGLVCDRLRAVLPFAWVGVVFDQDPRTTLPLRGGCHASGKLPLASEAFAAACLSISECAGGVAGDMFDLSPETGQVLRHKVVCKGRPVGVIVAGCKQGADRMATSYESQLLEAGAGYISAFAENVALHTDQKDLFFGTVQALTAAIDAKDRYTRGHSERVAWLGSRLAALAGLGPQQVERVRISGLVHDVGKIGVPERVLTKPGRLTDEEFGHIRQHPEIGFRILKDIPGLEDVVQGVLYHHERYDARGYPQGLGGEQIPLIARILAVADTFDAMSSNRSYRPALTREKTLAEIARVAGSQLDPVIAGLFPGVDLSEYDLMVARHAATDVGGAGALAA